MDGKWQQMKERRCSARRPVDRDVIAALSPEQALPNARTIDVSRGGMLMAFVEPVGFLPERRMLVVMRVEDFRFNALASVVRCERGADFRTYVAVKFVDVYTTDYDELCERLDHVERVSDDASA